MSAQGRKIDGRTWRANIVRVVLAAFLLRALIPAGFMPDFGAASRGVFQVVICSANGLEHLTLDVNGKPVHEQKSSHQHQPCAFSGLAAVALPDLAAGQVNAPDHRVIGLIAYRAIGLPPARAGPPLGSRGPPQIS